MGNFVPWKKQEEIVLQDIKARFVKIGKLKINLKKKMIGKDNKIKINDFYSLSNSSSNKFCYD